MKYFIRQINKIMFFFVIGILTVWSMPLTTTAEVKQQTVKKGMDMIAFYWVLFVVGGLIALTLTYVSWRKYRGEKRKTQPKTQDKKVD